MLAAAVAVGPLTGVMVAGARDGGGRRRDDRLAARRRLHALEEESIRLLCPPLITGSWPVPVARSSASRGATWSVGRSARCSSTRERAAGRRRGAWRVAARLPSPDAGGRRGGATLHGTCADQSGPVPMARLAVSAAGVAGSGCCRRDRQVGTGRTAITGRRIRGCCRGKRAARIRQGERGRRRGGARGTLDRHRRRGGEWRRG